MLKKSKKAHPDRAIPMGSFSSLERRSLRNNGKSRLREDSQHRMKSSEDLKTQASSYGHTTGSANHTWVTKDEESSKIRLSLGERSRPTKAMNKALHHDTAGRAEGTMRSPTRGATIHDPPSAVKRESHGRKRIHRSKSSSVRERDSLRRHRKAAIMPDEIDRDLDGSVRRDRGKSSSVRERDSLLRNRRAAIMAAADADNDLERCRRRDRSKSSSVRERNSLHRKRRAAIMTSESDDSESNIRDRDHSPRRNRRGAMVSMDEDPESRVSRALSRSRMVGQTPTVTDIQLQLAQEVANAIEGIESTSLRSALCRSRSASSGGHSNSARQLQGSPPNTSSHEAALTKGTSWSSIRRTNTSDAVVADYRDSSSPPRRISREDQKVYCCDRSPPRRVSRESQMTRSSHTKRLSKTDLKPGNKGGDELRNSTRVRRTMSARNRSVSPKRPQIIRRTRSEQEAPRRPPTDQHPTDRPTMDLTWSRVSATDANSCSAAGRSYQKRMALARQASSRCLLQSTLVAEEDEVEEEPVEVVVEEPVQGPQLPSAEDVSPTLDATPSHKKKNVSPTLDATSSHKKKDASPTLDATSSHKKKPVGRGMRLVRQISSRCMLQSSSSCKEAKGACPVHRSSSGGTSAVLVETKNTDPNENGKKENPMRPGLLVRQPSSRCLGLQRTNTNTSSASESTKDRSALEEMADVFKTLAKVKDRKYLLATYKSCFVASQLVDALVAAGVVETREEAVRQGQELEQELKLFQHVCGSSEHAFQDDYLFFRFGSWHTSQAKQNEILAKYQESLARVQKA